MLKINNMAIKIARAFRNDFLYFPINWIFFMNIFLKINLLPASAWLKSRNIYFADGANSTCSAFGGTLKSNKSPGNLGAKSHSVRNAMYWGTPAVFL